MQGSISFSIISRTSSLLNFGGLPTKSRSKNSGCTSSYPLHQLQRWEATEDQELFHSGRSNIHHMDNLLFIRFNCLYVQSHWVVVWVDRVVDMLPRHLLDMKEGPSCQPNWATYRLTWWTWEIYKTPWFMVTHQIYTSKFDCCSWGSTTALKTASTMQELWTLYLKFVGHRRFQQISAWEITAAETCKSLT